jgi:hypothetical protein
MRSWSGPTGQPARYDDGTSAAVIVATVPVNAGTRCVIGATVVDVTGAIVVVVDDSVVVDAVDVATVAGVVVELDRRSTARLDDDDPHAPVTSTIKTANARTRGRGSTGS